MKTYELTYIISSAASAEDITAIIKEIQTFAQSKGGIIISSHKSAASTLAYPIKKQHSGYYITETFQIGEEAVMGINTMLEKNANVLRQFLMVKKPTKVMKERRTRKPLFAEAEPVATFLADSKKSGPLDTADLDKKLGEILGE